MTAYIYPLVCMVWKSLSSHRAQGTEKKALSQGDAELIQLREILQPERRCATAAWEAV